MYYDLLDLLTPRAKYTATGSFYKRNPISNADYAESFSYRHVSNYSREWTRLFGNVQAQNGALVIATKEHLDVMAGESRVVLQDKRMYIITAIEENLPDTPPQAFRMLGKPLCVEYLLTLKEIQNSWGLA